jgi:hypothetical protein
MYFRNFMRFQIRVIYGLSKLTILFVKFQLYTAHKINKLLVFVRFFNLPVQFHFSRYGNSSEMTPLPYSFIIYFEQTTNRIK